jgi:hypothetical protein
MHERRLGARARGGRKGPLAKGAGRGGRGGWEGGHGRVSVGGHAREGGHMGEGERGCSQGGGRGGWARRRGRVGGWWEGARGGVEGGGVQEREVREREAQEGGGERLPMRGRERRVGGWPWEGERMRACTRGHAQEGGRMGEVGWEEGGRAREGG